MNSPPESMNVASSLDVIGMGCPLPVLMARKALAKLEPGAVLEVLASDPAAEADFAAFCCATGHRLMRVEKARDAYRFLIQKLRAD